MNRSRTIRPGVQMCQILRLCLLITGTCLRRRIHSSRAFLPLVSSRSWCTSGPMERRHPDGTCADSDALLSQLAHRMFTIIGPQFSPLFAKLDLNTSPASARRFSRALLPGDAKSPVSMLFAACALSSQNGKNVNWRKISNGHLYQQKIAKLNAKKDKLVLC